MIPGRLLAVISLCGLLLAAGMQNRYDSRVDYFAERSAFVSLPSGKALKVLSFGYHNLAADMLFIWAIQFYSTPYLTNRFDFLERVFDTISDISPRYRDPYIIGALIMVYEAGDVAMALRLLEKGSRHNPDEWFFDNDAGYYSYKFLKDVDKAETYYKRAAAKPGAPAFLKRMNAHMVYLSEDPKVAYGMWLDIYNNARDPFEKDMAFNHLYQIRAEIDLAQLKERIARFRERSGRWPTSLAELAGPGAGPFRDLQGNEYIYDPAKGAVTAAKVFRWKRR